MSTNRTDGPAATSGVARVHRALALLILAAGILQFFLAGLGAFGAESFELHRGIGSLLVLIALVVVVLAAVGRRPALPASGLLLGLLVLQSILGAAGEDVGILGGLHPVNGLAILGVAGLAASAGPLRFGHGRPGAAASR